MHRRATQHDPKTTRSATLRAAARAGVLFATPARDAPFEGPLRGLVEELRRRSGHKEGR